MHVCAHAKVHKHEHIGGHMHTRRMHSCRAVDRGHLILYCILYYPTPMHICAGRKPIFHEIPLYLCHRKERLHSGEAFYVESGSCEKSFSGSLFDRLPEGLIFSQLCVRCIIYDQREEIDGLR